MGTSASRAMLAHLRTIAAALAAFALTLGLAPSLLFAEELEPAGAPASVAVGSAPTASKGSSEAATLNSSVPTGNEGSVLASALAGPTASILSADVTLDATEPLIGSFTVDGLTYSVGSDGLTLVSVDPAAVSDGAIAIPASVTYNDVAYDVTSIAPYAFYLSGAAQVELPATIVSVGDRVFRSSDVECVDVAAGNPNYASFDGALYSADLSCLLLIPEGRAGAVLLPSEAEVVETGKFSHCSLVDAIFVEEDGANFASWEGLLYTADGTTLLRVPAGAVEITIRDGCTTIAAGAMEGCANLERIHAPASIISISPNVFTSIPTIALPVQTALRDEENPGVASALADQVNASTDFPEGAPSDEAETQTTSQSGADSSVASSLLGQSNASTNFVPQITAMVALAMMDDDLPEIDPSSIEVALPEGADEASWRAIFSSVSNGTLESQDGAATAMLQQANVANSSPFSSDLYTFISCQFDEDSYANGVLYSQVRGHKLDAGQWVRAGGYAAYRTMVTRDPRYDVLTAFITDVNGNPWTEDFYNFRSTEVGKYATNLFYWDAGLTSLVAPGTYDRDVQAYLGWGYTAYSINYAANGGAGTQAPSAGLDITQSLTLPSADDCGITQEAYRLAGWKAGERSFAPGSAVNVSDLASATGCAADLRSDAITLSAQWERVEYDLDFDVDSEPGDEDYPGEVKPDQSVNVESGPTVIEDPKRPGYVFQGWVIPSTDGTEAVDQELVYQDVDGKWYVDASKLPDYAGDDGRVELTARWTSVISVDVPQSVTFYADTVTQGQESREGAASSAFGQSKVENQSKVDLRVVGLESSAVETTGDTLGADSILKKAAAATPSTSAGKLLSLYPSAKQWTADELQDSDLKFEAKSADAVDFDLDDMLLEASFPSDAFTIPAGDTLNMGYRLNLTETGQQLDYDKLATLEDGQSAAIANVSYCFAADALPSDWGEPLWVENPDRSLNPAKYLLLSDIKAAADDLSANSTSSKYYDLYKDLLDAQVMSNGNPGKGPYFQLKVDGVYLPLQLIGICQDTRSENGKPAGLTFQVRDVYAFDTTGADGTFDCRMFHSNVGANAGGWGSSVMRGNLRADFLGRLDAKVAAAITPVTKRQQLGGGAYGATADFLQLTEEETIWLPSAYEVYGVAVSGYGLAEGPSVVKGYAPFQYEAYKGNNGSYTNSHALKMGTPPMDGVRGWWLRSCNCDTGFSVVNGAALCTGDVSTRAYGVAPAFCL